MKEDKKKEEEKKKTSVTPQQQKRNKPPKRSQGGTIEAAGNVRSTTPAPGNRHREAHASANQQQTDPVSQAAQFQQKAKAQTKTQTTGATLIMPQIQQQAPSIVNRRQQTDSEAIVVNTGGKNLEWKSRSLYQLKRIDPCRAKYLEAFLISEWSQMDKQSEVLLNDANEDKIHVQQRTVRRRRDLQQFIDATDAIRLNDHDGAHMFVGVQDSLAITEQEIATHSLALTFFDEPTASFLAAYTVGQMEYPNLSQFDINTCILVLIGHRLSCKGGSGCAACLMIANNQYYGQMSDFLFKRATNWDWMAYFFNRLTIDDDDSKDIDQFWNRKQSLDKSKVNWKIGDFSQAAQTGRDYRLLASPPREQIAKISVSQIGKSSYQQSIASIGGHIQRPNVDAALATAAAASVTDSADVVMSSDHAPITTTTTTLTTIPAAASTEDTQQITNTQQQQQESQQQPGATTQSSGQQQQQPQQQVVSNLITPNPAAQQQQQQQTTSSRVPPVDLREVQPPPLVLQPPPQMKVIKEKDEQITSWVNTNRGRTLNISLTSDRARYNSQQKRARESKQRQSSGQDNVGGTVLITPENIMQHYQQAFEEHKAGGGADRSISGGMQPTDNELQQQQQQQLQIDQVYGPPINQPASGPSYDDVLIYQAATNQFGLDDEEEDEDEEIDLLVHNADPNIDRRADPLTQNQLNTAERDLEQLFQEGDPIIGVILNALSPKGLEQSLRSQEQMQHQQVQHQTPRLSQILSQAQQSQQNQLQGGRDIITHRNVQFSTPPSKTAGRSSGSGGDNFTTQFQRRQPTGGHHQQHSLKLSQTQVQQQQQQQYQEGVSSSSYHSPVASGFGGGASYQPDVIMSNTSPESVGASSNQAGKKRSRDQISNKAATQNQQEISELIQMVQPDKQRGATSRDKQLNQLSSLNLLSSVVAGGAVSEDDDLIPQSPHMRRPGESEVTWINRIVKMASQYDKFVDVMRKIGRMGAGRIIPDTLTLFMDDNAPLTQLIPSHYMLMLYFIVEYFQIVKEPHRLHKTLLQLGIPKDKLDCFDQIFNIMAPKYRQMLYKRKQTIAKRKEEEAQAAANVNDGDDDEWGLGPVTKRRKKNSGTRLPTADQIAIEIAAHRDRLRQEGLFTRNLEIRKAASKIRAPRNSPSYLIAIFQKETIEWFMDNNDEFRDFVAKNKDLFYTDKELDQPTSIIVSNYLRDTIKMAVQSLWLGQDLQDVICELPLQVVFMINLWLGANSFFPHKETVMQRERRAEFIQAIGDCAELTQTDTVTYCMKFVNANSISHSWNLIAQAIAEQMPVCVDYSCFRSFMYFDAEIPQIWRSIFYYVCLTNEKPYLLRYIIGSHFDYQAAIAEGAPNVSEGIIDYLRNHTADMRALFVDLHGKIPLPVTMFGRTENRDIMVDHFENHSILHATDDDYFTDQEELLSLFLELETVEEAEYYINVSQGGLQYLEYFYAGYSVSTIFMVLDIMRRYCLMSNDILQYLKWSRKTSEAVFRIVLLILVIINQHSNPAFPDLKALTILIAQWPGEVQIELYEQLLNLEERVLVGLTFKILNDCFIKLSKFTNQQVLKFFQENDLWDMEQAVETMNKHAIKLSRPEWSDQDIDWLNYQHPISTSYGCDWRNMPIVEVANFLKDHVIANFFIDPYQCFITQKIVSEPIDYCTVTPGYGKTYMQYKTAAHYQRPPRLETDRLTTRTYKSVLLVQDGWMKTQFDIMAAKGEINFNDPYFQVETPDSIKLLPARSFDAIVIDEIDDVMYNNRITRDAQNRLVLFKDLIIRLKSAWSLSRIIGFSAYPQTSMFQHGKKIFGWKKADHFKPLNNMRDGGEPQDIKVLGYTGKSKQGYFDHVMKKASDLCRNQPVILFYHKRDKSNWSAITTKWQNAKPNAGLFLGYLSHDHVNAFTLPGFLLKLVCRNNGILMVCFEDFYRAVDLKFFSTAIVLLAVVIQCWSQAVQAVGRSSRMRMTQYGIIMVNGEVSSDEIYFQSLIAADQNDRFFQIRLIEEALVGPLNFFNSRNPDNQTVDDALAKSLSIDWTDSTKLTRSPFWLAITGIPRPSSGSQ